MNRGRGSEETEREAGRVEVGRGGGGGKKRKRAEWGRSLSPQLLRLVTFLQNMIAARQRCATY